MVIQPLIQTLTEVQKAPNRHFLSPHLSPRSLILHCSLTRLQTLSQICFSLSLLSFPFSAVSVFLSSPGSLSCSGSTRLLKQAMIPLLCNNNMENWQKADRELLLQLMLQLINDTDDNVRMYAIISLGKCSQIFGTFRYQSLVSALLNKQRTATIMEMLGTMTHDTDPQLQNQILDVLLETVATTTDNSARGQVRTSALFFLPL